MFPCLFWVSFFFSRCLELLPTSLDATLGTRRDQTLNFNIAFKISVIRDATPTLTLGLSRHLLRHMPRQSAPKTAPVAHRPDSKTRSGPCAPPPADHAKRVAMTRAPAGAAPVGHGSRRRLSRLLLHPHAETKATLCVRSSKTPRTRGCLPALRVPSARRIMCSFVPAPPRRALKGASLSVPLGP